MYIAYLIFNNRITKFQEATTHTWQTLTIMEMASKSYQMFLSPYTGQLTGRKKHEEYRMAQR